METIIDINGYQITGEQVRKITQDIIEILSKKNITYAVAYMILDKVREELQNTIIKKSS